MSKLGLGVMSLFQFDYFLWAEYNHFYTDSLNTFGNVGVTKIGYPGAPKSHQAIKT